MRTIKRYANRKLYDLQTGSYITLDEIASLIRQHEDVEIIDHASGQDLTTITLMQIIFEEEKRANSDLPRAALTRVLQAGAALRSSVNVFLDPESHFDTDLRRRFARLVRNAQIAEAEAQHWLELLLDPAMKTPEPIEIPAEPAEVDALRQKVEALENLIKNLGG